MEKKGIEDWKEVYSGGEQAFESLFKNHYKTLCNFAFSYLKDRDEAEDIVQQVFYILWNKKETMEIHSTISSYLFTSVKNACLNRIQHNKVRQEHFESNQYGNEGLSTTAHTVLGNELEHRIKLALNELPEQCGLVFRMSRFGHMKYAEIAEELNISVKTVENHMGKALKLMRVSLKEYLHIFIIALLLNF